VVYANDCYCVLNWQWQVGVAAVFLGWMVFVLFLSKFPYIGIYVVIFLKIFTSFVKMIVLTSILVFSFAIVFLMLFADETVKVLIKCNINVYTYIYIYITHYA